MHAPNPVRSIIGFLPIEPSSSSMFTGLPCWSSHLPVQGILILISIHQDATGLSPLINSVSLSLPPASQWVQYFSYLSMLHLLHQRPCTWVWNPYSFLSSDTSKQVFLPVLQQIWLQSTVCHRAVLLYLLPQNPVLLLDCSGWTPKLHSKLECFQTSTIWTMKISITCQRELSMWCPTLGASLCHKNVMSVHRALRFTSEKLAILDCNHFIKSTMNWYPEASKEPFYCILQILSKFTQLATISQIRLYF